MSATNGSANVCLADGREIVVVPDGPAMSPPSHPTIDDVDVNLCRWDGEPVDYDAAVDAMCIASGAVA